MKFNDFSVKLSTGRTLLIILHSFEVRIRINLRSKYNIQSHNIKSIEKIITDIENSKETKRIRNY